MPGPALRYARQSAGTGVAGDPSARVVDPVVVTEDASLSPDGSAPAVRDGWLRRHRRLAFGVLVGVSVAAAIALRLYVAVGPHSSPDSDEAVVGLMALRLLRHGTMPPAFYWGQTYGGSIEAFAVAPFVALFGTTTLGLRSASILFELTTSWLVWRVARHLFRPPASTFVGLISLFFPLTMVLFGTKERGFYPLTAALGFAAMLAAINVHKHPSQARYWMGLGLATGVGWWSSPNIAYYALPAVLWLLARGHGRQIRNVIIAAAAFLAGSAVWIDANIHSGLGSILRPPKVGGSSTYGSRLGFFWTHALPFASGLRGPWRGGWYVDAALGVTLYVAMLVVLVYALRHTKLLNAPDVFMLALSPLVFATFIGNWQLVEGRYEYFLASMIPFAFGRLAAVPVGRVVVAVVIAISTLGFVNGYTQLTRSNPGSMKPLAQTLVAHGYHTAMADYWSSFKMTYQSDELVIASPFPTMPGSRYKPYARDVYRSWPAYVFLGTGNQTNAVRLLDALAYRHIRFRFVESGPYFAILPDVRYVPARGGP